MSAADKLELLGLIDAAVAAGWAYVRACAALEVSDVRVHRWRARLREQGTVEDLAPGDKPGAPPARVGGAGDPRADRGVGLG